MTHWYVLPANRDSTFPRFHYYHKHPNGNPDGYIKFITDEIKKAIGNESDEKKACIKNVIYCVKEIEQSLEIQHYECDQGLKVIPALYDIETGMVEFLWFLIVFW